MTTITTDNYYEILGIQKNASLEDIKKAYRAKAKVLHPDKNKSPDAHENFILLNEAYEYLQNLKTGKFYDHTKKTYTARPKNKRTTEDRKNTEREKARARAQQYAKMQYEEFIKTDFYKSVASLDTIASHVGFFIALIVVILFPIVTTILYGVSGFGAALLINFIVSPMTVNAIRDSPSLNLGEFSNSVLHIVKTNGFLITTLSIINILIILKFGLQTLISPWLLLITHCVVIAVVFFVRKSKDEKFKLYYKAFCIAPLFINSLLLINFIFSFNPVNETYKFTNDLQASRRGYQESTYIYLENDTYEEYPGIRTFLDYEEMRNKKHVTYTLKKGILGFRVVTDYVFKP
jgi:hypothetical protein